MSALKVNGIRHTGASDNAIVLTSAEAVELYYDNVKQLETTASGCITANSPYVMLGISANQDVSNAGEHKVDWTTETVDRGGDFDTSNERFTAPVAGDYLICLSIHFTAQCNQLHTGIKKNGTNPGTNFDPWVNWGDDIRSGCTSAIINLAANDYIDLWTYQNSGATRALEVNRCKATIRFLG